MSYWAMAECERDQMVLIATTLGDRIPEDHAVRLFWELLETYDWREWEVCYDGQRGQPPIHPRIVAGVLLYGLTQGMRSSRKLEWACTHALDYLWLAEGRAIDHSTFCNFRRRFRAPLKALFRHLNQLARAVGVVRLNCVGIDGSRQPASASRHTTRTAAALERELAELDAKLEAMLEEAEAVDQQEARTLFGEDAAPLTQVPAELASATQRRARVQRALEQLRLRQAAGSQQQKVAVSDPEAPILPGKSGQVGPHYTPLIAVDTHRHWIVAETVMSDAPEASALLPLLEETRAAFGESPRQAVADSAFGTPENLAALEHGPSDAYVVPCGQRGPRGASTQSCVARVAGNPAERTRLDEALPPEHWPALPRTPGGKLARQAFAYDVQRDVYYCPMGRALPLVARHDYERRGRTIRRRAYQCENCSACPLQAECAAPHSRRWLRCHGQTPVRERMAAKLRSPAGRAIYQQRQQVELPFARIRRMLNLPGFLSPGLEAARHEWRWICMACNIQVFLNWLRALKRKLEQPAAAIS